MVREINVDLDDDEQRHAENEEQTVWQKPSTERLVTGGAWWSIFDFVGSTMALLMSITLSNLGEFQRALFVDVNAYQLFFRSFAALGFVGAGGKFIAEYIGRGDMKAAKESASAASKYNFLFTGLPTVMFAVILMFRFDPVTQSDQFGCYLLLVIYILFDRLRSCVDIFNIGFQRYDIFSLTYMTTHIWGNLLAFVLIRYGAFWGFFGFAITSILSFPLSLLGFKKVAKDAGLDWGVSTVFDWGNKGIALFKKLFKFNILFAIANVIFSLMISSLFITLGEMLGHMSYDERTAYGLIVNFASLYYGIFGLVAPVTNAISEAYGMRNPKLVKNYFLCVVKFPLLMAIAVTGGFIYFGSDLISVFYGSEWVGMGMFMFIFLFPGYALGSFASKYDNMLAGIGRPDVPIIPWFIGFSIAVGGIFLSSVLPQDLYMFSGMLSDVSIRFAFSIVSLSLGLFIAGFWIIRNTLKVFNLKLPKNYVLKPLFSIGLSIIIYFVMDLLLNFQDWLISILSNVLDPFLAEGINLVLKIVIILLFFIIFLIISGGLSLNDARFLKSVIKNIPGGIAVITIGSPIFKGILKLKIGESDKTQWLGTQNIGGVSDLQLFKVDLELSDNVSVMKIHDVESDLFDTVAYVKLNDVLIEKSIRINRHIPEDESVKIRYELNDLIGKDETHNKVQFFFDAYDRYSTDLPAKNLINRKIRIKDLDYRMRWNFEQTFYPK